MKSVNPKRYLAPILVLFAAGAVLIARRRRFGGTSKVESRQFDRDPGELFDAVQHATRHMPGWRVVDESESDLRIHAEARTLFMPDQHVVSAWVEKSGKQCALKVQCRSRFGWFGTNARAIRAFMKAVERELRLLDRPGNVGRPDPGVAVMTADEGAGPLLQRDYTGIVEGSGWAPEQVVREIRADIERFSPPEMAKFVRPPGENHPLEIGDDVEVHLSGAGETHVRVVHVEPQSFTLRTMDDHTEAGRITFGSWWDDRGRLVIHIRSRARQAGPVWLVGFILGGHAMQKLIWETFIERVAEASGGKLIEDVRSETKTVEESAADLGKVEAPTFNVPAAA